MNKQISLESTRLHKISDKLFKVAVYGPSNEDSALITHYLLSKKLIPKATAVKAAKNLLSGYFPEEEIDTQLAEEAIQYLFEFKDEIPFPKPKIRKFTFIDLFAGIGGFRMALQSLGGECVFSSEWDKQAQKTYYANFGEIPFGDITMESTKKWIPQNFDLLCGGFPCQPFSIAGVSKKISLGRKHGFEDEKQGNLFFHIAEILEKHRPKAFLLENVKNLVSHDKGNTFKVIKQTLLDLNYSFDHKVLDGKYFVPQHRERTIMVGFNKDHYGDEIRFDFSNVKIPDQTLPIKNILESKVDPKYTLSDKLWNYLQDYSKKHKEKGNGFGFGLVDLNSYSRTISARYYKDGAEILIPQKNKNPRRLTPKECAALQGFPNDRFVIPVSDNQAYKQFGNSVVMPLIQAVGEQIIEIL